MEIICSLSIDRHLILCFSVVRVHIGDRLRHFINVYIPALDNKMLCNMPNCEMFHCFSIEIGADLCYATKK